MGKTASIDAKGVRKYQHKYQVESTEIDDNESDINAVLPYNWFSAHPTDTLAKIKNITITQRYPDLKYWDVVFDWDTAFDLSDKHTTSPGSNNHPTDPGGNSNQTSPELRPWVVKRSSRDREVLLTKDNDDPQKPVVSAAGQPFDPGITTTVSNPTVSVTYYSLTIDPDRQADYVNHVNDAPFLGYATDWVRCMKYDQTSQREHNLWFYEINIEYEVQLGGWQLPVMNAGTLYFESAIKPLQQIKDKAGHPITAPVPLKADGTGPINAGDAPNYLSFRPYKRANFAVMF